MIDGGILTELVSGRTAVLACAGGIATVTVLATVNTTLRTFPQYDAVEEVPARSS